MYYINTLRITTTAIYFIAIFIATTKGGISWGLGVGIIGLLARFPLRDHIRSWEHRETLKVYARMIENIVVVSEYEGDREVMKRARNEAFLLAQSKNKEFLKGNLKIHAFFYQENLAVEEHIKKIKTGSADIISHLIQCHSYDRFILLVAQWREKDNATQYQTIAKEDGVWFIENALDQE